jgi:hypothetical protein
MAGSLLTGDTAAIGQAGLGLSAISAVGGAIGSYFSAQEQKTALQLQATTAKQSAQLADVNATSALAYAKSNSDTTLAIAGMNDDLTAKTTDFNVSIATMTNDFNQQVFSANEQAITAQGALEAQTHTANAELDETYAQETLQQGQQQEQQSRLQYADLKSTQRAHLGAAGVALDEGSALRIQTDTDFMSDVDASTIHTNAVRAALGYRVQEGNEQTAAEFSTINASTQALSEKAKALGADISSATDVSNMKLTASFQILQDQANAKIASANILQAGRTSAYNDKLQGMSLLASSGQATVAADAISPISVGASSLVAGATQVASKWYDLSKAGAFG